MEPGLNRNQIFFTFLLAKNSETAVMKSSYSIAMQFSMLPNLLDETDKRSDKSLLGK